MTPTIYDRPLSRLAYPLALSAAVIAITLVARTGLGVSETVLTIGAINLIYVIGLYIFVGNSGLVSFGHVGFAALGAYAVGILTVPANSKAVLLGRMPELLRDLTLPGVWAFAVAAMLVAVISGVFGFAIMKLRGIAASIVTLSFLVVTYEIFNNWRALGNGGTVTRIPTETTLELALAVAAAMIVIAYFFQTSSMGLRLRAARDEENAARALGIGVTLERTLAFVLGAVVVAVGGGLSARLTGTISPGSFFLGLTFLTMAMLVLGGMHSLSGAIAGTVLVTAFNEILRLAEAEISSLGIGFIGWRDIVLAAILIGLLILRPEGLTLGREYEAAVLPRRRRRATKDTLRTTQQ